MALTLSLLVFNLFEGNTSSLPIFIFISSLLCSLSNLSFLHVLRYHLYTSVCYLSYKKILIIFTDLIQVYKYFFALWLSLLRDANFFDQIYPSNA